MKLSDLLVNLRKELAEAENEKANLGIKHKYKINSIVVEVYVENIISGNSGVNLQVANFGASGARKNYHKINIELKPLPNK